MSAMGRYRPVAAEAGFSTWQPAMVDRTAGFGQERPLGAQQQDDFSQRYLMKGSDVSRRLRRHMR